MWWIRATVLSCRSFEMLAAAGIRWRRVGGDAEGARNHGEARAENWKEGTEREKNEDEAKELKLSFVPAWSVFRVILKEIKLDSNERGKASAERAHEEGGGLARGNGEEGKMQRRGDGNVAERR